MKLQIYLFHELASRKKTEELIGKYEINEFILYRFLNVDNQPELNIYLKRYLIYQKMK